MHLPDAVAVEAQVNVAVLALGADVVDGGVDGAEDGRGAGAHASADEADALAAVLRVVPHGPVDGDGQAHVVEAAREHARANLAGAALAVEGGLLLVGGGVCMYVLGGCLGPWGVGTERPSEPG